MSLRQKAVQGVLWSGIQNWGSGLITMVVIVTMVTMVTMAGPRAATVTDAPRVTGCCISRLLGS